MKVSKLKIGKLKISYPSSIRCCIVESKYLLKRLNKELDKMTAMLKKIENKGKKHLKDQESKVKKKIKKKVKIKE